VRVTCCPWLILKLCDGPGAKNRKPAGVTVTLPVPVPAPDATRVVVPTFTPIAWIPTEVIPEGMVTETDDTIPAPPPFSTKVFGSLLVSVNVRSDGRGEAMERLTPPCNPLPIETGLMVTGTPAGALMVMTKFEVKVCCGTLESFTVIWAVVVPAALGVPERKPLPLMVNPAGRVEDEKVYPAVPPVADIVWP